MPFVSKLKHRKPFNPRIDLEQRLLDVVIILEAIRPLNILPSAKREMLDRALWLVAELSGDFSPRYRELLKMVLQGEVNNISPVRAARLI